MVDRPAPDREGKQHILRGLGFRRVGQERGFCQNSRQTRRREVKAEFSLRCFENSEHTVGTTQVKQATAAGGDVLVVAGAGAEEVAELVVASKEALRGCEALEPAHTSRAPFHAPVVLLKPIVMGWPAPLPCCASTTLAF